MAPTRKHDKSFTCTECHETFQGDRNRHMRSHAHAVDKELLKWRCAACPFGDLQKHNVIEHYVRTHTQDEPHECTFTIVNSHGKTIPCPFRCQSSSILTKHKKDVHKYNPKEDKAHRSSPGKLRAYEKFVIPPLARYDRTRDSASSLPPHPAMLSFPIPPSASSSAYPQFDAVYQASLAQLPYVHPADYSRIPKQESLNVGSLARPGPYPNHPGWGTPQYPTSQSFAAQSNLLGLQQWAAFPAAAPQYGHSRW